MGRMQAEAMAEAVDLETAIGWHLQHNHYPPVPPEMVAVCIRALRKVNGGYGWERRVRLPEGVTYKGKTLAPVWAIVQSHHLEPWLHDYEEEEW